MNKKYSLTSLLLILAMTSCSGATNESTLEESNSSSVDSSNSEENSVVDNFLTSPIYDGKDVVASRVVTKNNKTYLEVDGVPFTYIGTQIRVDAFMNCDKFTYTQIKSLFNEASKLNVSCVQIPLEWAKIEVKENEFDYTYIFNMLQFANEYNLHVEFLWYGTNMCGDTHSYTVPDYILKDGKTYPKFDAKRTGEYWNYYGIQWFLDFDDENLMNKESNALSKVMDYIYDYDSNHGGKKIVIGMQVLNEPDIFVRWRIYQKEVLSRETNQIMSEEEGYSKIKNSLNKLGMAVKNSKYKVFTRVNFASSTNADYNGNANGIYSGNTIKDAPAFVKDIYNLDGIDIVGDDSYTSSVKNIKGIANMFANKLPGNFSHIAENDGSYANTASLILASAQQGAGYSMYDLITSPFFVKNNSANIDQGVIEFNGNDYSSYKYKAHYEETRSIISGLKNVSYDLSIVDSSSFATFNLKNDNPSKSYTQSINTNNVKMSFSTSTGAIGFALDLSDHIDVYFTNDATISFENITITAINEGSYVNEVFISNNECNVNTSYSFKANTLYRIDYKDKVNELTSNTFDEIGG